MSALTTPRLPIERIVLVAQFLAGSFHYGTLAHLSQTSRKIHQETESVLFETLLWDTEEKSWILHGGRVPRGWSHVKYVLLCLMMRAGLTTPFPQIPRDSGKLASRSLSIHQLHHGRYGRRQPFVHLPRVDDGRRQTLFRTGQAQGRKRNGSHERNALQIHHLVHAADRARYRYQTPPNHLFQRIGTRMDGSFSGLSYMGRTSLESHPKEGDFSETSRWSRRVVQARLARCTQCRSRFPAIAPSRRWTLVARVGERGSLSDGCDRAHGYVERVFPVNSKSTPR